MIEVGGSKPSRATSPIRRDRIIWHDKLGDPTCYYMERWVINLRRLGSIRLHHWLRGDDVRARHDHPQDFLTLVLKGSYIDDTPTGQERMTVGAFRHRKAEHIHTVITNGCWTLLYFWPKRRNWGFWHPNRRGNGFRWFKHSTWIEWKGDVPCE